ncbi:MAG TPA: YdcF family protein, partial [Candidatus Cryosericum sp.]
PFIFLSGGPTGGTLTEPDVMANVALGLGVPRSALVLDARGTSTASTLDNLRHFMTNNGMTSCLMVSSPFHMARIMTLAALKGLHPVTCPPATSPVSANLALQARAIAREELALIKDLAVLVFSP